MVTANGAVGASAIGLSAAFRGLWAVIAAHPFVAVAAGIAAATGALVHFYAEAKTQQLNTATAEAKQAAIAKATQIAGRAVKDYTEAIKINQAAVDIQSAKYDKNVEAQRKRIEGELLLGRITKQQASDQLLAIKVDEKANDVKNSRVSLNESLKQSERQIQEEIKATGISVGEMLTALKNNEAGFKVWAKEVKLSSETVAYLESKLKGSTAAAKDSVKAATEAEKAAEKHAKAVQAQADALEKLGIVTENQVLKTLGEFATLIKLATDAGVPLDRVMQALNPHLEELGKKAKHSGIDIAQFAGALNAGTGAAKRLLDELARAGMPAVVTGLSKLPGEIVKLNYVTSVAAIQAQNMADSFHFFGLSTQAELEKTARDAVTHFNAIKASGTATAKQIEEAFDKMNAALVAAGKKSAQTFAGAMKDALGNALQGLGQNVVQAIADGITTGDWTSAKDQIQDGISQFLSTSVASAINFFIPGLGTLLQPLIKAFTDKLVGLFRDSAHEHTNDLRDAFLLTFGPGGTGLESGFGRLAAQLAKVQGGAAAFKALLDAKTPEAFAKAMERVNDMLSKTPEALAAAAGFQTKAQLEAAAVAAVKLHAYMRDSGLYTAAAVQKAWEDANAALIAAGHAGAEAASKASEEIEKLKGELKSLNESVAAEETEEVMGVIETQQRARIAAIEEEIKAKEEAIEAERQAREEAAAAAAADAKSYSDQRKAEYDSEYAYLSDLFSRGVKIPATFVYSNSPGSAPSYGSRGGVVTRNGIMPKYMAMGGPVNWKPRGSDTVPAMLDPTEVVLTEGHTGNIGNTLRDAMSFVNSLKQDMSARVPGFSAGPVTSAARPSITVLQVDKRELGRAVADVLPGELRRLGVRVQA
jgi:hypothetical protein